MKKKMLCMILAAVLFLGMTDFETFAEKESLPAAEMIAEEAYETEEAGKESAQEETGLNPETELAAEGEWNPETEPAAEEEWDPEMEPAAEEEWDPETEPAEEEELSQAVENEAEAGKDEEPGRETDAEEEPRTIIGFQKLGEEQSRIYLAKSRKPDLAELLKKLPGQLEVYLDDSAESVAIDVSWYCVGEDYEASDGYYFQFSPQWDEEKYVLSESIDLLREAPFVGIFFSDYEDELVRGSVTGRENETIIFEFLVNEIGVNNAGACGVLANIYYESGFNPNALGDNGTSYGICQWHSSRWTSMWEWCGSNGYDSTTLVGQLNYLKFELSRNNSSYLWNGKTIYNYIASVGNTADGAYDAGYYWCYYFEVPANREQLSVTRGNLARNIYWAEYSDYIADGGEASDGWPFRDVKVEPGSWRYDSVKYVYDNNIMNGITNMNGTITSFAPDQPLTRGMFATVLYRMAGSPAVAYDDRFSDVLPGRYYSDAIIWAAKNKIVNGLDNGTRYGTEENITREQIAKMLMEYAKLRQYDVNERAELNSFPDKSAVSSWAAEYIRWAVGCGMINGKNIGGIYYLDPQGEATRVECAAMLMRFLNKYQ